MRRHCGSNVTRKCVSDSPGIFSSMRKPTSQPGRFVELTTGAVALVIKVVENEYGTFYNILLSDGTSLTVDSHSVNLPSE